jgi:hypothetical protein
LAATDTVKTSIEATVYYNKNYTANENTTEGWNKLSYCTDFSLDEKANPYKYYDKFKKMPNKRGRPENTGSITHLLTNYGASFFKLARDNTPVAIKIEITDNGWGLPGETYYIDTVNFEDRSIKFGNTNEAGDITITVNFSYNTFTVV